MDLPIFVVLEPEDGFEIRSLDARCFKRVKEKKNVDFTLLIECKVFFEDIGFEVYFI